MTLAKRLKRAVPDMIMAKIAHFNEEGTMAEQSRPGQGGSPGSSKQGIEQKANQATQRVAEKAQSGFENARTNVTTQVNAVAQALTSAADKLQQQDQSGLSQRAKQYVQKAEQAAQYLQDKSPQELK